MMMLCSKKRKWVEIKEQEKKLPQSIAAYDSLNKVSHFRSSPLWWTATPQGVTTHTETHSFQEEDAATVLKGCSQSWTDSMNLIKQTPILTIDQFYFVKTDIYWLQLLKSED